MSFLHLLLNELEQQRRSRHQDVYDQHFGLGLLEDELSHPNRILAMPLSSGYIRPWRNLSAGDSGLSTIQKGKNDYKVNLDVQQFKPEELKVSVEDDYIVVEGKHEEREDQHGFISRQFKRKYKVPSEVDLSHLVSHLSSDGVLSLSAPKKVETQTQSREIPITRTNAPAVKETKEKNHINNMEE